MILLLANAGTPLMWAQMCYLLPVNLLIGAAEGWLLARWLRVPVLRGVRWMILANYASMIAGCLAAAGTLSLTAGYVDEDILHRLPWALLVAYLLFFGITVAVEYPIAARLKNPDSPRSFLKGFLLTQVLSNVVVLLYFGSASFAGIYTKAKVEEGPDFLKPVPATLYYLSADSTEVRTLRLDSGKSGVAKRFPEPKPTAFLSIRRNEGGGGVYLTYHPFWEEVQPADILIQSTSQDRLFPSNGLRQSLYGYRSRIDWRPKKSEPSASAGSWPAEGILMDRDMIGFEVPFAFPRSWCLTILPTNQAIYQFNEDQIMVLDLKTRQLARLLRGRSPVVMMDEGVVSTPEEPAPALAPAPPGGT